MKGKTEVMNEVDVQSVEPPSSYESELSPLLVVFGLLSGNSGTLKVRKKDSRCTATLRVRGEKTKTSGRGPLEALLELAKLYEQVPFESLLGYKDVPPEGRLSDVLLFEWIEQRAHAGNIVSVRSEAGSSGQVMVATMTEEGSGEVWLMVKSQSGVRVALRALHRCYCNAITTSQEGK
jgi:hypothetical protein